MKPSDMVISIRGVPFDIRGGGSRVILKNNSCKQMCTIEKFLQNTKEEKNSAPFL